MASNAIQDILGWVALTRAVNQIKDGVPNPFPSWLFSVAAEDRVVGNSFKFNRTYGTRKTARVRDYGAPARHRELQQEELAEAKTIDFGETRIFKPLELQCLRDYESYDNADKAKRLVANNIKTMGTLFGNSRIVAVATLLNKGFIYVDVDGNLLATSSGAVPSAGYASQIPSANIGTILDNNSAGIFGATGGGSWANSSTNIPLQLRRLRQWAAMDHGYVPKIALYGRSVPEYLSQNDYVLDFMARNPGMNADRLQNNEIPDGLFDFQWIPAWLASYTNDAGTKTSLWNNDGITFMPGQEDKSSFWGFAEGSNFVPRTIDIVSDAMASLSNLEMVHGAHGYAQATHNPVSVSMYMGDNFLPYVKTVGTVYIADVVA